MKITLLILTATTLLAPFGANSVHATTSIPWGIGTGILNPPPPPGGGVAYTAQSFEPTFKAAIPSELPGGSTGPTVPESTDPLAWLAAAEHPTLCDGGDECTSSYALTLPWPQIFNSYLSSNTEASFRPGGMPVLGSGGPTIGYVYPAETVAAFVEGGAGGGGGDPKDPSIKVSDIAVEYLENAFTEPHQPTMPWEPTFVGYGATANIPQGIPAFDSSVAMAATPGPAVDTMSAAWIGPVIVGTIVRLWPRKAH